MQDPAFQQLLAQVRQCQLCAADLPEAPKPILQASVHSRILIAGQAPGLVTHQRGVPFDDASGKRLRQWLGVSDQQFYDPELFAILPMGFCYPGKARSGDKPPRPECARNWRQALLDQLPDIQLTLLIGRHAQDWHLPKDGLTLSERVEQWQQYAPTHLPLPHPSPRNNPWLKKHPWFEQQLIPALQQQIAAILDKKTP